MTFEPCSEDAACKISGSQTIFKFDSWTKSKGLICELKSVRENGKFFALFTNSVICFIFLNLADVFGRRFVMVLNSIIIVTSMMLANILPSFYAKMILLGVAYGCEGTFSSLFVFFMNEITCSFGFENSKVQQDQK